ncbi:MAG: acetylornithine transaminase [bacterium]|nr:acetylornithine transaminase [bacterium]
MNTFQIKELATKYIMNTYGERDLAIVKGQGAICWDADGKEYLDFVGGIAVNILGHCHPAVTQAVKSQLDTLIHVSNLYYIEPQVKLAELLCNLSFGEKCFFCNSGAEANETAIKLARKYAKLTFGSNKFEIITMLGSFHGRTLAAITATGQPKYQQGFEPLVPGFVYATFNDLDSVKQKINEYTCAIMVEPIQGESGIHPATSEFLAGLRELCNRYNLLLIYDEVQCGLARTGKLFAYELYNIPPDIMTLAKGLGGGVPIGATITTNKIANAFSPGNHASTFGGNPLSTAAALATLQTIQTERLWENAAQFGAYFYSKLEDLQKKYSFITAVRGKGLMLGIQLDRAGKPFVAKCAEKGLLINCVADNVLRFLPPLIIQKNHIDSAIQILEQVFAEVK